MELWQGGGLYVACKGRGGLGYKNDQNGGLLGHRYFRAQVGKKKSWTRDVRKAGAGALSREILVPLPYH